MTVRPAFRRFWHSSVNRFLTWCVLGVLGVTIMFLVLGAPWWMSLIPLVGTILLALYVLRAVSGRH